MQSFVDWCGKHIAGDEKGEAQLFIEHLFQAFNHQGAKDIGGVFEERIKKSAEDGGGTSFADFVWKPVVLIEMKKRGADLARHYQQAFKYWERLVPGRPHISPRRVGSTQLRRASRGRRSGMIRDGFRPAGVVGSTAIGGRGLPGRTRPRQVRPRPKSAKSMQPMQVSVGQDGVLAPIFSSIFDGRTHRLRSQLARLMSIRL